MCAAVNKYIWNGTPVNWCSPVPFILQDLKARPWDKQIMGEKNVSNTMNLWMYASGKQTIGLWQYIQVRTPALPIHGSRDTNCTSCWYLGNITGVWPVLRELGKLTGARQATGASDAGRGYRRARLNFHFFPDDSIMLLVVIVLAHVPFSKCVEECTPGDFEVVRFIGKNGENFWDGKLLFNIELLNEILKSVDVFANWYGWGCNLSGLGSRST